MSMRDTYLTDEELQRLIVDVEARDLVPAPPDMLENILGRLSESTVSVATDSMAEIKRNRKKEFQLYCFRVISSVAAAIMLLFILPKVSEIMPKTSEVMQEMAAVYKPQVILRYETKEDAINDKGFWIETFGNRNLFDNELEWNIFK